MKQPRPKTSAADRYGKASAHKPHEDMKTINQTAAAIVSGPRRKSYGDAKASFERIARSWSDILRSPVTSRQVALCMVALKVLRDSNKPKRDNLVDIAGYAELADKL